MDSDTGCTQIQQEDALSEKHNATRGLSGESQTSGVGVLPIQFSHNSDIVNKTALKRLSRYGCKTKKFPTKKKGGISPGAVHLTKQAQSQLVTMENAILDLS